MTALNYLKECFLKTLGKKETLLNNATNDDDDGVIWLCQQWMWWQRWEKNEAFASSALTWESLLMQPSNFPTTDLNSQLQMSIILGKSLTIMTWILCVSQDQKDQWLTFHDFFNKFLFLGKFDTRIYILNEFIFVKSVIQEFTF